MYMHGKGVRKSVAFANRLFETASRGGDRRAQLYYGYALMDGNGVRQDWRKAKYWLAEAQKSTDKRISEAAAKGLEREEPQASNPGQNSDPGATVAAMFGLAVLIAVFGNMEDSSGLVYTGDTPQQALKRQQRIIDNATFWMMDP
jgi:hypothetical protein